MTSVRLRRILHARSPEQDGYDVVILSDLLHFHNSHPALLSSLTSLLARTPSARSYVAAGTYTPPHVCSNFVRLAESAGLRVEEGELDDVWRGEKEVRRAGKLNLNELGVRKAMCRWWTVSWKD